MVAQNEVSQMISVQNQMITILTTAGQCLSQLLSCAMWHKSSHWPHVSEQSDYVPIKLSLRH
jgi:hypothetical protein